MSAVKTISEIIDIGRGSLPLAIKDMSNGTMFLSSIATQKTCTEIALFTDILSWQYDSLPNDDTLRGTANYLIWLCGKFGMKAQAARGSGGSAVIPVPPSALGLYPLEFEVDGSSPIPTGGNSIMLNSGGTDFRGYNLIVTRNNISQTQINNGGSYYTWNRVTGAFGIVGDAAATELLSITPTI